MPVDFATFDSSVKLRRVCDEFGLNDRECNKLEKYVGEICGAGKKPRAKRARSQWQECIASRRKGKPFDPQAIKTLAKEYRAGTCPP